MKVKSESEVAQSCPTLSDPMDCSLPGSSVHGIFQARELEGVVIYLSGMGHQYLSKHVVFKSNDISLICDVAGATGQPLVCGYTIYIYFIFFNFPPIFFFLISQFTSFYTD